MNTEATSGKTGNFKVVETLDELIQVFMVRAIVFIEEQNVPFAEEMDAFEYGSVHILGQSDGEPMAAGRIRFLGETAKLERICVRKAWRGRHLGHALVDFMMDRARERGIKKFKMHAQAHLTDFYGGHGFKATGPLFYEANIPHYLMTKEEFSL